VALVAVKMFSHLIYFIKKFHKCCTLSVCVEKFHKCCTLSVCVAKIMLYITVEHTEKSLFLSTLMGDIMLVY
jgi:hypothetical protein